MRDMDELFKKTLALVKECGITLKTAVKEEKESKIKEDGSIVTKYDLLIDKKLSQELKGMANCTVLSQEYKEDIGNTYFVIDPIDGTHNFDMKWDFFGIMVSYVLEKETVFSIIHLSMLNIVCTAIKGKGAYLNGKRVYTKKMTDRLVGGCPVTKNNLESITKIVNSKENVELRSLFCMAAEQTYVISGVFDFAYSVNTGSIWDFVAVELMIKEAGGIMKLKKLENGKYNAIYGSKEAVEKIENIIMAIILSFESKP